MSMRKYYCDFSAKKLIEEKKYILNAKPYLSNLNCKNCDKDLISWMPYRMGYCEECWEKGYGKMPEITKLKIKKIERQITDNILNKICPYCVLHNHNKCTPFFRLILDEKNKNYRPICEGFMNPAVDIIHLKETGEYREKNES